MDERIAAIVERLDRNQRIWGPDVAWLVDALETAQAESDFQHRRADAFCKAAMRREVENKNLEAERDVVEAENTRLQQLLTDFANTGDARIESLEDQGDRLTNQITDLRLYLDKVANTAFGSNSAGLRLLRAEARDLLARCSPNEETAEDKKSRCKFCGSTEAGPVGSDGLMVCPDCAAEATA